MRITRETPVDSGFHEMLEHGTREFPAEVEFLDLARQPGGMVNWHWHEDVQFFLVKEGVVTFRVSRTAHEVKAGEGLFVNSGVMHMAGSATGEGAYYCLNIAPVLLMQFAGSVFEQRYVAPFLGRAFYEGLKLSPSVNWQGAVLKRLTDFFSELDEPSFGWEYRASALFSELWLAVVSHAAAADEPVADRRKTQAVSRMMEYVNQHLAQRIALADVAQAVGRSPSECCRQFKAVARMTIGKYAEACRMEKAAQLLKTTRWPVARIAEATGFASSAYFIRVFGRAMGTTPAKFRRSAVE